MSERPFTVAVAVGQGFSARALLQGRLPGLLRERGARLGIFVPSPALPSLSSRFADDAAISLHRLHGEESDTDRLANYLRLLVADWRATPTFALRERERWAATSWRRALWPLRRHLVAPAAARRAWHALENRLLPDRHHGEEMARLRPDVLLTATPGLLPGDRRLIRRARAMRVPSVAYVQGWDNLTSKAIIGARPDHLLVWSERQREEAQRLHGFAPAEITVTGPLHFDEYAHRARWRSREAIRGALGVPSRARLVLLAGAPQRYYPDTAAVARLLADACANGELGADAALVARVHPQATSGPDANAELLRQALDGRAVVDVPDATPGFEHGGADGGRWIGELVAAADVVVTIFSSMILDAAVLDRPVVNVAFDADAAARRPYLQSVRRYLDTAHYAPVVASGAVTVAESAGGLVAAVCAALDQPAAARAARRRLVLETCGAVDGGAAERVTTALARLAMAGGPVADRCHPAARASSSARSYARS